MKIVEYIGPLVDDPISCGLRSFRRWCNSRHWRQLIPALRACSFALSVIFLPCYLGTRHSTPRTDLGHERFRMGIPINMSDTAHPRLKVNRAQTCFLEAGASIVWNHSDFGTGCGIGRGSQQLQFPRVLVTMLNSQRAPRIQGRRNRNCAIVTWTGAASRKLGFFFFKKKTPKKKKKKKTRGPFWQSCRDNSVSTRTVGPFIDARRVFLASCSLSIGAGITGLGTVLEPASYIEGTLET